MILQAMILAVLVVHNGRMLHERQNTLLTLLSAVGGESGALDFQKLLFLYCNELQRTPSYQFVPYKFGGFSFTSYADKRKLVERGLLVDDESSWRIAQPRKVEALVKPERRRIAEQFLKRYSGLRGNDLVAETYRRYPYFAIRSEVAAKLLAKEPKALAAIKAASPPKRSAGIVTVGYEGRTLEAYLNLLIGGGVTRLCDVRRNPISRKYGFSKSTLSHACMSVGIAYEHLPQLGIASDERRELETKADYDALFETYRRQALPKETEALGTIADWVVKGERVALTCFERLPEHCHRHCVAEALEKKSGKAFSPTHL
jgi:hypothetical protein